MKLLFKTIIICLLFSNFLISQELIAENRKSNPVTILFVWNSYIYYGDSLHNHFKRMVEEYLTDYDGGASVKSATIGGSRLKHHDVERLIKPKAISSVKHFDLVILQGASRCASPPQASLRTTRRSPSGSSSMPGDRSAEANPGESGRRGAAGKVIKR